LKGLEASIARASQLERTSRIDAEFFQRRFLRSAGLIANWQRQSVARLAHVSDGNHFSISDDFIDVGIPYYRGQDVTNRFFVETASPIHITQEAYDRKYMRRSYLKQGDVLLSIIGTIGELSLVASERPATCSCKLAILRPHKIKPEFLAVFLRSEHGQNQIERFTRGAVQKGLILEDMDQLWVPQVSTEFEERIFQVISKSRTAQEASGTYLQLAEDNVVIALGLADWTPPEPLSYSARASDAFAVGRLDAQYFMPAKEQVRNSLAALPGRVLGDRMDSVRDMFVPKRVPPDMLVRNYDVTDALVPLLDAEKMPQAADEIGSIKKTFKDGDLAISRLRAYLREIAVVRTGDNIPSVGSSEFIVLRPKAGEQDISPETLMVFLRSTPAQTILKWCQDGSQHPRFSESDLLSIPVPDAVASVSAEITSIVQEGFAARYKAHQLLEAAKRAVEIAIEAGEVAALTFLDAIEGES
jgi:type I restriction enzyme S subunit